MNAITYPVSSNQSSTMTARPLDTPPANNSTNSRNSIDQTFLDTQNVDTDWFYRDREDMPQRANNSSKNNNEGGLWNGIKNFFSGIGNFFSNLFGFGSNSTPAPNQQQPPQGVSPHDLNAWVSRDIEASRAAAPDPIGFPASGTPALRDLNIPHGNIIGDGRNQWQYNANHNAWTQYNGAAQTTTMEF